MNWNFKMTNEDYDMLAECVVIDSGPSSKGCAHVGYRHPDGRLFVALKGDCGTLHGILEVTKEELDKYV